MINFLIVIHVIVCIFLILVVLLQQGKGQDIGSAFGGGGSQTTFGSRSRTSFLSKLTTVAAAIFMSTSISLTIMISQPGRGSVIDADALSVPALPIGGPLAVPGAGTIDSEEIDPAEDGEVLAPPPGEDTEN